MTDLDRYAKPTTDFTYKPWLYEFPNGHRASVIVDHRTPFRFELEAHVAVTGPAGILTGLTSEQVEEKLALVQALPADADNIVNVTASAFDSPPIRTYRDGSQTYGPHGRREAF